MANTVLGAGKIHHTVVVSASAEFTRISLGGALHQDTLCGANHILADDLCLL